MQNRENVEINQRIESKFKIRKKNILSMLIGEITSYNTRQKQSEVIKRQTQAGPATST